MSDESSFGGWKRLQRKPGAILMHWFLVLVFTRYHLFIFLVFVHLFIKKPSFVGKMKTIVIPNCTHLLS